MHTIRICRSAGQHVILLQHIHSIPRLIVSGGGEGRGRHLHAICIYLREDLGRIVNRLSTLFSGVYSDIGGTKTRQEPQTGEWRDVTQRACCGLDCEHLCLVVWARGAAWVAGE